MFAHCSFIVYPTLTWLHSWRLSDSLVLNSFRSLLRGPRRSTSECLPFSSCTMCDHVRYLSPPLSPSQAFYLKHVDKTLALVIVDLSPLPPPPSREQCSATEEPLPPRNRERHDDESAAAPSKAWHAGHESLYSYGDDHLGSNVDEAARLSDEQAWRYCCGRRQIFPATFAVYRHFRSKG